jgi:hypothetical protein
MGLRDSFLTAGNAGLGAQYYWRRGSAFVHRTRCARRDSAASQAATHALAEAFVVQG